METELQKIYDSEINVEISWFWDGGVTVKLGDPMNGYRAQTDVRKVSEVILWLQRAIAKYYPDSTYIKNLDHAPIPLDDADGTPDICIYRCPHCAAVNSFPGWTQMFAFICWSCGEPVTPEAAVQ